jgi:hypothetical protein
MVRIKIEYFSRANVKASFALKKVAAGGDFLTKNS